MTTRPLGAWPLAAIAAVMCAWGGCSTPAAFSCEQDTQCLLAGQPGVCHVNGHCAYPDSECASGYRHPEGAPSGLAGQCAQSGQPATTGGSAASSGGVAEGETAADIGSTSDGAQSSTASSGTVSTGTDDDGASQGSSGELVIPPCGEDTLIIDLPTVADSFFSNRTEQCNPACDQLNFGATEQHAVGADALGESLMAARLDLLPLQGITVEIVGVRVQVWIDAARTLPSAATLRVMPLAPLAWVEGGGKEEQASRGESTWEFASVPDLPWGETGPPEAINGPELASTSDIATNGPAELSLDVDQDALKEWLAAESDSVLVRASNAPYDTLRVLSRESPDAGPLTLSIEVCAP